MNSTLIVIPARGGSKGIPRKNLRPLGGRPLISYAISAARSLGEGVRVVVSTDDDEIALFAARFGADVIMRPAELASDEVTIDPVIVHATEEAERRWREHYEQIITVQPTSPLVRGEDIEGAVRLMKSEGAETVISAVDDRHLRWRKDGGIIVPDYSARVNRQKLPPSFRETGAIIGCRRDVLDRGTRIGKRIALYLVDAARSIDIDTLQDFWLCESLLQRKRIVFSVVGSRETGLGHAYRSVMLAHELVRFDIVFVCGDEDDLARAHILAHNYPVETCAADSRLETIFALRPDMVINDILDTSADYIMALKKEGILVVNFEDMGYGAEVADLVINALYPHQMPREHILVGPRYFCLRDEFLYIPERQRTNLVERVLITFGGVDEGNLTCRTLDAVAPYLVADGISIDVIVGPGYGHHDDMQETVARINSPLITIVTATPRISDYMTRSDLAITSGGRTVLELVSLGMPIIVICQNQRETTHTFASSENGIINLGLRHDVSNEELLRVVKAAVTDAELREAMRGKGRRMSLRQGKNRVIRKIAGLFGQQGKDD